MKKNNYEYITILITYLVLMLAIVMYITFANNFITIPKCPIYTHFGLYCPACGGTRAIISLFHFNLIESIKYNPVVIYTFITTTIYLIIETINRVLHKNKVVKWNIFIKIGLILLLFNWIIQNIIIIVLNH